MSHRDIHIDFNNCIDPEGKTGISDADLEGALPQWLQVHRALHAMAEMGQIQFTHLPYLEGSIDDIQIRAAAIADRFDHLVVLGIGGSALGAEAIQEACLGSVVPGEARPGQKKLTVLDTLDPDYLSRFLDSLDLEKTAFNVVSKSGNTVETMSQFLIVYDRLKKSLGEKNFRSHLIMTTDPEQGALRRLCREENLESFEILKGVGGRFSVLSPVGLFPAAFLGISIQELTEGARHMDRRCQLEDLWTNPAAMLSLVVWLLHQKKSCNQWVVMNYSENLRSTQDWFGQLVAESLGKEKSLEGKIVNAGITPILSSGPRDQHSQVQLYSEGPRDKMVMFWQQEQFNKDLVVPEIFSEVDSLGYLGGKKLSDILYAEMLATEQALKEAGVPNFKMTVLQSDAYSLGQIFYLYEVSTVYLGGLLNVNPYDQPGVELGKKYIYGKLGRQGYEEYAGILGRKLKDKRYLV